MTTLTTRRMRLGTLLTSGAAVAALAVTGISGPAAAASAAPLTNLAHLDFLLDTAEPEAVDGHTTYRLAEEPQLVLPWTYADARDGGTFERVGGGPLDATTGDWGQGAYNADDVARAAVVYLRHWELTGEDSSRTSAYELLRSLAYLQTSSGPNSGNVVLWMQPDGELNPSAEPVELPDPSDSGPSYWTARTLWAFGEGFAAFEDNDPDFAAFLAERLALSRTAVDTQVLDRYGEYEQSDGLKVPAWLIVDGADASAEAVLGLSAYVDASGDPAARETLRKLAEGIAAMGAASGADTRAWPYGAILPWAQSRSMWHAWGSQMPAALAAASGTLGSSKLLKPAVRDAAVFTPTLLLAGGPDNGWFPAPTDTTQIAYGADSRVQSLLAVSDATGSPAFDQLAAIQAAWFFGANRASAPMYDPATGVTFDGLAPDGTINRNSGAESTIHGLLSMIALDARPDVAARAQGVTTVSQRDGLRLLDAETGSGGEISTPESAWTGESLYSGDVLAVKAGSKAVFPIGADDQPRVVESVQWIEPGDRMVSGWTSGILPLGLLSIRGPEQGISPTPGVLLPQALQLPVPARATTVTVRPLIGTAHIDDLIVRPLVSRMLVTGASGVTQLLQSAARIPWRTTVGVGSPASLSVYDASGRLVTHRDIGPSARAVLPAGGFAVVTR
ncbi:MULTISPECIES: hypothetical protein [unclassified Leifsonia]|uniref:hypothetical protein n=1 Tax=unclassified Leifsonia TaxID=2663824 RepID=UPI0006F892C8|nr:MULTISPECIES: hypothetical protein [unclassified Leifsonia]KQX04993.1 hypothetical protein ASC59_12185 [Leifsonia sp. Root1293]KRA08625.1 hypothetical protein ASD61_12185 [Leifsonia sp. Root60]